MSSVNIKRAVENIRSNTNKYTPIVEVLVNSIDAIEEKPSKTGHITVIIIRDNQDEMYSSGEIVGFEVEDDGIGFDKEHREAFDTLYTTQKISQGGKGFGRFTFLKYFEKVFYESVFFEDGEYWKRKFEMGKYNDIIEKEKVEISKVNSTGTVAKLYGPNKASYDQSMESIAKNLVEMILPYFVDDNKVCPKITLEDNFERGSIVLNNYLEDPNNAPIKEVELDTNSFILKSSKGEETFRSRVFKIYSPRTNTSRVSLVAHRREVVSTPLNNYIPEFSEEFFDRNSVSEAYQGKNFIVKVYVFGDYLDRNVSLERSTFEFQRDSDLIFGISQKEIEEEASRFAKEAVSGEVEERSKRKIERVQEYVREQAPWYASLLKEIDFSDIPYKPSNEVIDSFLHQKEYRKEQQIKGEVKELLESGGLDEIRENASSVVEKISEKSKSELSHYVALRRNVIDLFDRSLSVDQDGCYVYEEVVHDIIFPRKTESGEISFEEHNLWLVDERLNFSEFLSSDKPFGSSSEERPDLLAFDKRVGFRGDNEPSNPVTIFEFKRPQRDDFVNQSQEDPVQQLTRYVIKIRNGEYKTPRGRDIRISSNTPFYGYIICDLTSKVKEWVETEKDFKPMPDTLGYFSWHENLNLYIELLSWDKILNDASKRNKIFFHKLGLD